MSKHTPGPWFISNRNPLRVIESGPRMASIAKCGIKLGVDADEEAAANARLIAAAPDMLEVLREAELVLAEKLRRLGADPQVSPTYNRIRDVIVKAKGEVT